MQQADALAYIEQLEELSALYASDVISDAQAFPQPHTPDIKRRTLRRKGHVEALEWNSHYTLLRPEVREAYSTEANARVHARLFGKSSERVIVCVHGYMGGNLELEERIWPVDLFKQRGFDVALIALPHHGPRMAPGVRRPLYPGTDVRMTLEGICQGVFDVRTLVGALYEQGYKHVGISGMSLGGYVTSLCIGLDARLAFGVPVIPLVSFGQLAREFDTLVGDDDQTRTRHLHAVEALCTLIDPLARKPLVPVDKLLVVGGALDAVVSIDHARRLATHFGCPLEQFDGGHLVQRGRRAAFARALDVAEYACL